jgi:pimeloyl-ACP methyl ester carboxylesterase
MAAGDVGVALVPGAGLGSWIWERVLPRLRAPAQAVDLPGRVERPADRRTVTLESVADAVAADIRERGPGRVVLVGHSLGGVLLPAVAARVPERVARPDELAAVLDDAVTRVS